MRYIDFSHVPMGVIDAAMGAPSSHPTSVDVGVYGGCRSLTGGVLGIVECVPCADEPSKDRFVWKTQRGETLVEFTRGDITTLFEALLNSVVEKSG